MARNLQSHTFVRKQRLKIWLGGSGIVVGLVLIICGLSWITRVNFMSLTTVTVFGADQEIAPAIQQKVVDELQGSYLGIFSRKNALLYPKNSIATSIKQTFARVLDVSITRDSLTSLRVTVNQKVPRAIICSTLPDFNDDVLAVNSDDPCYYADESGYLFEKSPGFSGHPYNLYYMPDLMGVGSTTDFVGSYATSTKEFALIQSFYDAAESVGIPVDGILAKADGEYELYASSTIIYFNDDQGLAHERDDLIAFWQHNQAQNRTQKKALVFDYIDLRYGSNVFYKLVK